MAVSMVLFQVNHRYASPLLAIANRWLRWIIFAFGAAYIVRDFEFIHRPYWVLSVVFFLVWFLGETLYNWLAISALSVSPLPLFPRYAANQSGEEWPTQSRLLKVREWLRAAEWNLRAARCIHRCCLPRDNAAGADAVAGRCQDPAPDFARRHRGLVRAGRHRAADRDGICLRRRRHPGPGR